MLALWEPEPWPISKTHPCHLSPLFKIIPVLLSSSPTLPSLSFICVSYILGSQEIVLGICCYGCP